MSVGSILLQNPWVQFYLLLVGALSAAAIWDRLCNSTATRDDCPGEAEVQTRGTGTPEETRLPRPQQKILGRCQGRGGGRIRK
jgi:hypothetical protein